MMPTLFRVAADLVVIVHGLFVVFVVLGGLLVMRWPRVALVHVPAGVWGALIEFAGWICPLTPLENYFREGSGQAAYQGEFVEHYILPVLYPAQLTRGLQIGLGALVVFMNVIVYWRVMGMARRPTDRGRRPAPTIRSLGDRGEA